MKSKPMRSRGRWKKIRKREQIASYQSKGKKQKRQKSLKKNRVLELNLNGSKNTLKWKIGEKMLLDLQKLENTKDKKKKRKFSLII